MSEKRIHMCVNVRGLINHLRAMRKNAKTHMTGDDGRLLSRDAAIDACLDEIAKGHKVIPMSKCCGNPCKNSGCAGFDYSGGGCPGYKIS